MRIFVPWIFVVGIGGPEGSLRSPVLICDRNLSPSPKCSMNRVTLQRLLVVLEYNAQRNQLTEVLDGPIQTNGLY